MERLINLTNKKENKLSDLHEKKDQFRLNMENPRVINDNAQEIYDTERSIKLLCEAIDLADDTGSNSLSAREILEDIKNHYTELKQDIESVGKNSDDLEKDIKIIENIINNDIDESNIEQTANNETPVQEQSSNEGGLSKTTEDIDITDLSSFDDF